MSADGEQQISSAFAADGHIQPGLMFPCVPSCRCQVVQEAKDMAEACGSRNYLELILQVLPRKPLDGIGRT